MNKAWLAPWELLLWTVNLPGGGRAGIRLLCGLGLLTGDKEGDDQPDQGEDQHDGEGHAERLACRPHDRDQHRAHQRRAKR